MNNFKLLRISHNLSAENLAVILGLKRSSSVFNIETGRAFPSYEVLERYANLFAVSVDWLMNRSSVMYTKDSLLFAEKNALEILQSYEVGKDYVASFPSFYLDSNEREECYSCAVRANIVFILSYSYKHFIEYLDSCSRVNNDTASLFDRAFNYLIDKKYMEYVDSDLKEKDEELIKSLWFLLSRRNQTPVFDVGKVSIKDVIATNQKSLAPAI